MTLLVNSPYGKSSMLSFFAHSLLIAVFLIMPPAAPVERAKNLAEVKILPVPPTQQSQTAPSPQEAQMPSQTEAASQAQDSGEAEAAPQAEALAGEAGMPSSVGLRSGKGTGIPRMTGITPVRAGSGGGGGSAATAVYTPKPSYPPAARKDGWQGSVVLQIRVNADGSVTVLSVLESARDDVSAAAVETVANWQYSPERNGSGSPVSSVRNVRVNFDLTDA